MDIGIDSFVAGSNNMITGLKKADMEKAVGHFRNQFLKSKWLVLVTHNSEIIIVYKHKDYIMPNLKCWDGYKLQIKESAGLSLL